MVAGFTSTFEEEVGVPGAGPAQPRVSRPKFLEAAQQSSFLPQPQSYGFKKSGAQAGARSLCKRQVHLRMGSGQQGPAGQGRWGDWGDRYTRETCWPEALSEQPGGLGLGHAQGGRG